MKTPREERVLIGWEEIL